MFSYVVRSPTPIVLLALLACLGVEAAPPAKQSPQLDPTPVGGVSEVTLGGLTYRHHGLVGVGVLPADTLDRRGDTLGSFSSFKIDPTTWRRLPDGSYAGTLYTLPDRGYNVAGVIDYPARLQKFALTFRPDATSLKVGQDQLTLKLEDTITLRDFQGATTTGLSPVGATLGDYSPIPTASGRSGGRCRGAGAGGRRKFLRVGGIRPDDLSLRPRRTDVRCHHAAPRLPASLQTRLGSVGFRDRVPPPRPPRQVGVVKTKVLRRST